jgi:hypothetical protein
MATQVEQGERRVISPKVPKVVNVKVRSGFKNFQFTYDAAKGIKDLLFYEIQNSTVPNFSEYTTYTIPQTALTLSAPFENQPAYFRVRCINSKFEAGPWSRIVTTTSRSFFRIESFNVGQLENNDSPADIGQGGQTTVTDIAVANWDTWTEVGGIDYSPSKGHICVQFHAGAQVSCINHFDSTTAVSTDGFLQYTNDISVKLRVKRDGVVMSDDGEMNVHAWGFQRRDRVNPILVQVNRYEQQVYSTLFTAFEAYDGSGPIVTYTIEAKVLKETHASLITGADSSGEYNPEVDPITVRAYDDFVRILCCNVSILEILELS